MALSPQTGEVTFGEMLYNGAEARLYAGSFYGRPAVLKERLRKEYRHPSLDEKIRTKRLAQEARTLTRVRKLGVRTPTVFFVDAPNCALWMERVFGRTFKEVIRAATEYHEVYPLARSVGAVIARLHDGDVIHGDLTTSNVMITDATETGAGAEEKSVVMIDFGLSTTSQLAEDKAVDLYVLERAFLSTHPNSEQLFEHLLEGYQDSTTKGKAVIAKLSQVRARGRKKLCFG
eukprot:TRINITY_DN68427_c0_g1_i1.p1 TRINITY_DN68427_c0_g1~~TRINITY_DN68427_c0_g1_i1.p1  ORF type:complete len:232 (-),score=38.33 TRINITY_DN68427_c0_g1_i1:24-719(-)